MDLTDENVPTIGRSETSVLQQSEEQKSGLEKKLRSSKKQDQSPASGGANRQESNHVWTCKPHFAVVILLSI